jgi:hypothetical protein
VVPGKPTQDRTYQATSEDHKHQDRFQGSQNPRTQRFQHERGLRYAADGEEKDECHRDP